LGVLGLIPSTLAAAKEVSAKGISLSQLAGDKPGLLPLASLA